MTDLEIDHALALAIGWKENQIDAGRYFDKNKVALCLRPKIYPHEASWEFFSHRDWNVIGPIAARYNCFPFMRDDGTWYNMVNSRVYADTPQKAIALAVIEGAKK